jgi:hypothetical protein
VLHTSPFTLKLMHDLHRDDLMRAAEQVRQADLARAQMAEHSPQYSPISGLRQFFAGLTRARMGTPAYR